MAGFAHHFARVASCRMSGGTASRWGVSRDHAVGDYDIFFLFDFDETHRSWPLKAASYGGLAAVCDRDVIRGTISMWGSMNVDGREACSTSVSARATTRIQLRSMSAQSERAEGLMKEAEAPWSAVIGLAEAQPHLQPWQTPCRGQASVQ